MENNKPVLDELGDTLGVDYSEETKQAVSSEVPENVKDSVIEEAVETVPEVKEKEVNTVTDTPQPVETSNVTAIVHKKRGPKPKIRAEVGAEGDLVPASPVKVPRKEQGRGRPRILSEAKRKATQIFLTDSERQLAINLGKGQMSTGIRIALEAYKANEPVA